MLDTVDLNAHLKRKQWEAAMDGPAGLRLRLWRLHDALRQHGVAALIAMEGWDGAGRGRVASRLAEHLDPRSADIHYAAVLEEERRGRPWLWPYWVRTPARGRASVFLPGWWQPVFDAFVANKGGQRRLRAAREFERWLTDDGVIVCKLFYHLSRKEQERRLEADADDPYRQWRVDPQDWKRHRRYRRYASAIEQVMTETDRPESPWVVVAATSRRWAEVETFRALCDLWTTALKDRGHPVPAEEAATP